MTVVFKRPYQFVPPHRGNLWPWLIQRLRLIDLHLQRKESVVSHETRHMDRFEASLRRGDGILLAPNHCRYADPIVLGWPARVLNTHLYAMASWHLFNDSRFISFALQKMGAFSINREASDRQSLETAIDILATAERPLVLFPEGTTNRTNDVLKPMLDGVSFIARTAARRRAKKSDGQVVIHPVGLKYLCVGDVHEWAAVQLRELEQRIGWGPGTHLGILPRTLRLTEAFLTLKEIEYLGSAHSGDWCSRRDALTHHLLEQSERRLGLVTTPQASERERVRAIRAEAVSRFFGAAGGSVGIDPVAAESLQRDTMAADVAQQLLSFPDCYLQPGQATDTRLVETIQRMQEAIFGKASDTIDLHVVIEFAEAIAVPPQKAPRGQADPLLQQLEDQLSAVVQRLSTEARPLGDA